MKFTTATVTATVISAILGLAAAAEPIHPLLSRRAEPSGPQSLMARKLTRFDKMPDNTVDCNFNHLDAVGDDILRTIIDSLRAEPDVPVCTINLGGKKKDYGDKPGDSAILDGDRGWHRAGSCDDSLGDERGIIRLQTFDYAGDHYCLYQREIADAAEEILKTCSGFKEEGKTTGIKSFVGWHWVSMGTRESCNDVGKFP